MNVKLQKMHICIFYGITRNPVGPKLQCRIQRVTFKQICARGESPALSDVWHEHECHISLQLCPHSGGSIENIQQKRERGEMCLNT